MTPVFLILNVIFITFTGSDASMFLTSNLGNHLSNLNESRFPTEDSESYRNETKTYIVDHFQSYNLTTIVQNFTTTISQDNELKEIQGANIIGVSESSTENAPVLVIATYYDNTLPNAASIETLIGDPLVETGASVAVLLETSRAFQRQQMDSTHNITVVFVALDLNVRHYMPYGHGRPGSSFFVNDWLKIEYKNILGIVFLDSIATFNLAPQSQRFPDQFQIMYPSAFEEIRNSEQRGNFLGLLHSQADERLAKKFRSSYLKIMNVTAVDDSMRKEKFYPLDMPFSFNSKIETYFSVILKNSPLLTMQDFWIEYGKTSTPMMMLSDMGKTRTDQTCHSSCPIDMFWTQTRKEFLSATTRALITLGLQYEGLENEEVYEDEIQPDRPTTETSEYSTTTIFSPTTIEIIPVDSMFTSENSATRPPSITVTELLLSNLLAMCLSWIVFIN